MRTTADFLDITFWESCSPEILDSMKQRYIGIALALEDRGDKRVAENIRGVASLIGAYKIALAHNRTLKKKLEKTNED